MKLWIVRNIEPAHDRETGEEYPVYHWNSVSTTREGCLDKFITDALHRPDKNPFQWYEMNFVGRDEQFPPQWATVQLEVTELKS